MTLSIEPFDADEHLPAVHNIINHHLQAVIPGWALPANTILRHLTCNPAQPVIDPWVIERQTLCAMQNGRLVAAAHLLRYGSSPTVGDWYRNAGDAAWFVAWPDSPEGGAALLAAVREQMAAWGVQSVMAWDSSLPAGLVSGVPDCWPHIRRQLSDAGFSAMHRRDEAIFGGWLESIAPPAQQAPLPDVRLRRQMQTPYGVAFTAFHDERAIGWCQVIGDLTDGGDLPALRGWGELSEMHVDEAYRNRGLGAWLVRHAVQWLRLAGCDRVLLSVDSEDEARGAGRFYQRFGWNALSRMEVGWGYQLSPPPLSP